MRGGGKFTRVVWDGMWSGGVNVVEWNRDCVGGSLIGGWLTVTEGVFPVEYVSSN